MANVALLVDLPDSGSGLTAAIADLAGYLRRCGLAAGLSIEPVSAAAVDADVVLVFADRPAGPPGRPGPSGGRGSGVEVGDGPGESALLMLAGRGVPVLLAGSTLAGWRDAGGLLEAAGMVPDRPTPVHEIRLRRGPDGADVAARMPPDLRLTDRWTPLDKVADDVEVLLTANLATVDHPVMTLRRGPAGTVGSCTIGAEPATVRDPAYQRLIHRWVRAAIGERDRGPARIGLLGYGAIGHEHSAAIAAVEGLELAAVCDTNPARIAAARALAPQLRGYDSGAALLADPDLDLVVVSTPPNTHADWALRALEAGKSCVVEKPFCLTVAEADEVIAAAAERGRTLVVYQNRRWDADYLALRRLVRAGAVGEVFHYESFVGSYGHPCNFWHSDEAISGGAIYDWGSHYLDWALDLLPQPVEHVTAATHKRVWHDVTNADHSRVTIRFADGAEAEFVHSDLAAALKPKWYVLGTRGAMQGDWRHATVVARDAVGNLAEDRLAAAESPASLRLFTPDGTGRVHETSLAVPPPPVQPFHRELADRLLSGVPMSVPPAASRRTIAVMEAATVSARGGGRPVSPAGS